MKNKDQLKNWSLFLLLNDEHQGEGGTLVFIASNITTIFFLLQAPIYYKIIRFLCENFFKKNSKKYLTLKCVH